jgi:phosphoribosylformylglycinamidine (FGAM) synthase-like amidotransferase family enzyme
MKTGWVVLIALVSLLLGFAAGAALGGTTGAVGGGLAGICYTTQIAVKEGLISEQQSAALLQAIGTKYAATASRLEVKGDLQAVCRDILAKNP